MSHCLVYKKGSAAIVRGVECEFKRVKYSEVATYVNSGWVRSVTELIGEKTLAERFAEDPFKLTKSEHKEYGETLGLTLSKRMREESMIEKIQEVLNVD